MRAIAYVSTASSNLLREDLEAIVAASRGRNAESGITGVLLYCDGHFMQYIEGPDAAVLEAFERIRRDARHYQVNELLNQAITEREFADWTLGFTRASPATVLDPTTRSWDRPDHDGPGVEMLRVFWRNCRSVTA
ncbi:MAG TPA: BLUF domain-containing protein [Burkholderiaceae bacterium]